MKILITLLIIAFIILGSIFITNEVEYKLKRSLPQVKTIIAEVLAKYELQIECQMGETIRCTIGGRRR